MRFQLGIVIPVLNQWRSMAFATFATRAEALEAYDKIAPLVRGDKLYFTVFDSRDSKWLVGGPDGPV